MSQRYKGPFEVRTRITLSAPEHVEGLHEATDEADDHAHALLSTGRYVLVIVIDRPTQDCIVHLPQPSE